MWYIITAILYLTGAKAYEFSAINSYPYNSEDRSRLAHSGVILHTCTYPGHHHPQSAEPSRILLNNNNNPYLSSAATVTHYGDSYHGLVNRLPTGIKNYPLQLDYRTNLGTKLSLSEHEPTDSDASSYYEDLVLVENFGNYLIKATYIDPQTSTSLNDAPHQFNALLTVIIALGRIVRNACSDFDHVYDQAYFQTVNTFYEYGLAHADRLASIIEEDNRKGITHLQKIRKLKQEECQKTVFCSVAVDGKIKTSPLLFVSELETLGALSQLARNYYMYMEEFKQAAKEGRVLSYLQENKERIKHYIWHVVNSVNHITDRQVKCT